MLQDLRRIRKDEEVFGDVLGPGGKRTPITAVVAGLSDPQDPSGHNGGGTEANQPHEDNEDVVDAEFEEVRN